MDRLNSDFIEKIILKGMLSDKDFLVLTSSVFESEYFDDPSIGHIFNFCKEYSDEYNSIPSRDSIINSTETPDEIREILDQVDQVDFNIAESYEFLLNQSNDYLKEKALKQAIINSIDDVDIADRRNLVQKRIEQALIKDIKIDLGLKYFEEIGVRLRRIFTASENRIPTYFSVFDEYINGGFPPLTFNVFTAKIHGGKSNLMANFASRQVVNGKNVVILTLEMSQDAFAQRFDGIYSRLDVNRIYISRTYKRRLFESLRNIKRETEETRGELFIKEYPTGEASVLDFRGYLRELMLRDINIDIIYVDYINLMKSAYKVENNMYSSVKRVAEELRALSFEFKCPIVSVSQVNREGFFVNFNELDFSYTAESMGIPATADFMCLLGTDEEQMVYESEILYRITKSRIGLPNQQNKFFLDKRSLKMYDSSEEDVWIEDATISGDNRRQVVIDEERNNRRNRRRRD
jgi:replicative DNA helicase